MSKRKYKSFGYLGNTNQCKAITKRGIRCKNFWKKHITRALCSVHWTKHVKEISKRGSLV